MSLIADFQDSFGGPRIARVPDWATDYLPADLDLAGHDLIGLDISDLSFGAQVAHSVWAGPKSGAASAPVFRVLEPFEIGAQPHSDALDSLSLLSDPSVTGLLLLEINAPDTTSFMMVNHGGGPSYFSASEAAEFMQESITEIDDATLLGIRQLDFRASLPPSSIFLSIETGSLADTAPDGSNGIEFGGVGFASPGTDDPYAAEVVVGKAYGVKALMFGGGAGANRNLIVADFHGQIDRETIGTNSGLDTLNVFCDSLQVKMARMRTGVFTMYIDGDVTSAVGIDNIIQTQSDSAIFRAVVGIRNEMRAFKNGAVMTNPVLYQGKFTSALGGVHSGVSKGIDFSGWTATGATSSYAIYADASIGIGATPWFIYSLSTVPSLFSGPIRMDNLIRMKGYTVAQLNSLSSPSAGDSAYCTDATLPTYRATVAGSGTAKCRVIYDGTNWICC